jgi:chemotaxis family two-component system sensor kinase Cph1
MSDLAVCSREPIHIPGAIQPHGTLLAFSDPDLICRQVSANAAELFPQGTAWLLEKTDREIFGADVIRAAVSGDPTIESPIPIKLQDRDFDAVVHRHSGMVIVEIEACGGRSLASQHRRLQKGLADLRSAPDLPALHAEAARFVAVFTGFERVMVYRFDHDWHGEVVGECLTADVASYMGHHFPASDIPEQARALYSKNWLRLIPDADYQPVPLEPPLNPLTGQPLDLSFSSLRSVSPIHLLYLRNMDVRASMSISIMDGDRLWGLVACHHRTPLHLSYATRAACEIYGQFLSREISSKLQTQRLEEQAQATTIQTRFFDFIAEEQNFVDALVKYTPDLLRFMSAAGAAIFAGGKLTLLGETPPEDETRTLVEWLGTQELNPLFATDSLGASFAPAQDWTRVASGLLAVKLSRVEPHYVLWFRPETPSTITWAGDPQKSEELALHPRKSFAAWKQTITGKSLPWSETERQGARELRNAINALVLRRTERLISLNSELEKKNSDLNSFAYVASHDLKEPLRGIANYTSFLIEDHAKALPAEGLHKLKTIAGLATRSEELLDALNHFSRVGRMEIQREPVDMNQLLDEVIESNSSALEGVHLTRPPSLPEASCDAVLVREVFGNLLTNAARYNVRPEKKITIGWKEDNNREVYTVSDNGIGIREKHQEAIFHIFRRLHAAQDYGGGTGAGLAIVKSIVERHGGQIWVDSVPNEGSTFSFTLS